MLKMQPIDETKSLAAYLRLLPSLVDGIRQYYFQIGFRHGHENHWLGVFMKKSGAPTDDWRTHKPLSSSFASKPMEGELSWRAKPIVAQADVLETTRSDVNSNLNRSSKFSMNGNTPRGGMDPRQHSSGMMPPYAQQAQYYPQYYGYVPDYQQDFMQHQGVYPPMHYQRMSYVQPMYDESNYGSLGRNAYGMQREPMMRRQGYAATPSAHLASEMERKKFMDESLSSERNAFWKTQLCQKYMAEGMCPYGHHCTYAHGTQELRERPSISSTTPPVDQAALNPNFKTRLCERFMNDGHCPYAAKCCYAHGYDELRDRQISDTESVEEPKKLPTSVTAPALPSTRVISASKESIAPIVTQSKLRRGDEANLSLQDIMDSQGKSGDRSWIQTVSEEDMSKYAKKSDDLSLDRSMEKLSLESSLDRDLKNYFTQEHTLAEQFKEVTRVEMKHNLTKQQLFNVLIPALFDDKEDISLMISSRLPLLVKFISNINDQLCLLRSWERYCVANSNWQLKLALVLKALYFAEMIEEDSVLQWHAACAHEATKKQAEPFINWLETAQEESDQEE